MQSNWSARVNSNYRSLDLRNQGIELRNFTVLLGPNNGGKSQFLRSLVLWDAIRDVLTAGPTEGYHLSGTAITSRKSIAQSLINSGFRDLAEELAILLKSGKKLTLKWTTTCRDFPTLMDAALVAYGERYPHRFNAKKLGLTTPSRTLEFSAKIGLKRSIHELVLEHCSIRGLWENAELHFEAAGRLSAEENKDELVAPATSTIHRIFWEFRKQRMVHADFNRRRARQFRSTWNELITTPYHDNYLMDLAMGIFLKRIVSFLPKVTYLGPIRLVNDRDYAVAAGTAARTVGRHGEFTWVQLKELENASGEAQYWFEQTARRVLGIQNVKSGRESPTFPKVTAQIRGKSLPLHSFGLGTSQIIPILVQLARSRPQSQVERSLIRRRSMLGETPEILVIEEPESHLHPAAQKALTDALAQFSLEGGKLLIETHSEVVVRALELNIVRGAMLPPARAIVNWVDYRPDRSRGQPRLLTLGFGPDGGLQGNIPATFDHVVPDLIQKRLLEGPS